MTDLAASMRIHLRVRSVTQAIHQQLDHFLGFTATDLNDFRGTRTVEQGAREAVRLALLGPDGPTGTFSNENGPVLW